MNLSSDLESREIERKRQDEIRRREEEERREAEKRKALFLEQEKWRQEATQNRSQKRYCPMCGGILKGEEKFCMNCGTELNNK